ncbi:UDP-N-acetylmuramoyl-tripeptide--D-alanyl-D-alanine ligase [Spirulina sp. CS-785/01]|uniref:UDP-N-acetylmuramoyl-tripeptide--D-alanyl-D- alanine ligase n=1 Tax=Spirulina sp. CS-785/01 TaxID=3021716 RepID=UPI00232EA09E|nr:UDP-N-acetylmuramoyl-tripeptide--D-alanyl-D-alanine ligase [Spirulina sp. CS-785/01]MDB9311751.1 UDP-N-acetylmuramoyl-tripeptide--D-alanyl-D-alanine ligase [Spirulina sp. CS-785/01]
MSLPLQLSQLPDILQSPGSSVAGNVPITGVSTDTRTLQAGDLFVALRGESFDGHQFIPQAVDKGAGALVVQESVMVDTAPHVPLLRVKDTLQAYQRLGRWWRDQFEIPVIGLTGSVGKTTTKELIAAVLGTRGTVLKTQKNYNNEIGVPKTLLGLTKEHDYAVVEMAMRGRGQIAELTEIARPTIGLITNVGTAHIGLLGSQEAIAEAKCELLATMPSESIALLNGDNRRLLETAQGVWSGNCFTYGLEGGDLRGRLLDSYTLQVEDELFPLPLAGRHNASNYLAALAVAKLLGVDWSLLKGGITVELPGGRAKRYGLPNQVTLLDETYNAGYESMVAALEMLKDTPAQRHIAVLGTMKELGEKSWELHYRVGEMVKALQLDELWVLVDDPEVEAIAEGAKGVTSHCFRSREALIEALKLELRSGDCLLCKASNSVGLSQVVEALINH